MVYWLLGSVWQVYFMNVKRPNKFVSFFPSLKNCISFILHNSQPQIQLVLTKSILIIISSKWHHGGTRKWSYDRNLKKRVSKIWRQTKVSKLLVCHNWCQQCSLCWWSQSQELTPEKVFWIERRQYSKMLFINVFMEWVKWPCQLKFLRISPEFSKSPVSKEIAS